MKLAGPLQESLITILLFGDPKEAKAVSAMIAASDFALYYKELAEAAIAHLTQFGVVAGDHALDLVEALKEQFPERATTYDSLFRSILTSRKGLQTAFVLSKAAVFARWAAAKKAIGKALDGLDRDDEQGLDAAEAAMLGVKNVNAVEFSPGTRLDGSLSGWREEEGEAIPLGIPALDEYNLGPKRGEAWLLLGAQKGGKSMALTHVGKCAMIAGDQVVHLSLENSERVATARYVQTLCGFSKYSKEARVCTFTRKGTEVTLAEEVVVSQTINSPSALSKARKKLAELSSSRRPIIVKGFPSGTLTVRAMEAYLDRLEADGVRTDTLIIDYPDIMRLEGATTPAAHRLALGRLFVDLRGIAASRNLRLVIATQSNRDGAKSTRMDNTHLGEDFSKGATVDTMISIGRTPLEKKLGLSRWYVALSRNAPDGMEVVLSQNMDAAQYVLDSAVYDEFTAKAIKELAERPE